MSNTKFLSLCLILASGFSFIAQAGTEIKINNAKIDPSTDPPTLTINGANFGAFDNLTVVVGDSILGEGLCNIQQEAITFSLAGVTINRGETWTVSVTAGNGPSRNEEIDVAIPFDTAPSTCSEGEQQTCYSVAPETFNVGLCVAGLRTCSSGEFGACNGEITPAELDQCGDGFENDCDGFADEGCSCDLNPNGCDDGIACTTDTCVPEALGTGYSCTNELQDGYCRISGVCYADGARSPGRLRSLR